MADQFQYDVFLSHSAKDKAVVRPLAERLRKDGAKVWFDEWVLTVASVYDRRLEFGHFRGMNDERCGNLLA